MPVSEPFRRWLLLVYRITLHNLYRFITWSSFLHLFIVYCYVVYSTQQQAYVQCYNVKTSDAVCMMFDKCPDDAYLCVPLYVYHASNWWFCWLKAAALSPSVYVNIYLLTGEQQLHITSLRMWISWRFTRHYSLFLPAQKSWIFDVFCVSQTNY